MKLAALVVFYLWLFFSVGFFISIVWRSSTQRDNRKKLSFKAATAIVVGMTALGFLLQNTTSLRTFSIPAGSMIPTLRVGDYILTRTLLEDEELSRGDVVVFRQPSNESIYFVKRLVGMPGDEISVNGGLLQINGDFVVRDFEKVGTATDGINITKYTDFRETLPNGASHIIRELSDNGFADNTRQHRVPEDHYFVMGDNRDNSNDSRFSSLGYVPRENIEYKAQFIYFSHNGMARIWEIWKWPKAIRFSRMGVTIQ
jgi:signal peptidase I